MAKRGGDKVLKITLGMDKTLADQTAKKFHQEEKQRIKELLTDEQVATKAKNQLIEETNRKRVQEAKKAADGEKQSWFDVKKMVDSASEGVTGYLTGLVSLGTASAIFTSVINYWDQLRRQAFEAAVGVEEYRKSLKVLASLTSGTGSTSEALAGQVELRASTFLTAEQAKALEQRGRASAFAYLDDPDAGRKGRISKGAFDKMLTVAGLGAQLMGPEQAGAWGGVAGILPGMMQPKNGKMITADEGEQLMTKLFKMQQMGGFSDFGQFAGQFESSSVLATNKFYTPEQMAALLDVLSVGHGNTASTLLDQATRATSMGFLRDRGMKVNSEVDFEKSSQYMKGLGINKDTTPFMRNLAVARDVAKQMEGKPTFDYHAYLGSRGFINQGDRDALAALAAGVSTGLMDQMVGEMGKDYQAGTLQGLFEKRMVDEPSFGAAMSQQMGEISSVKRGLPKERLLALKRAAFNKLKDEGVVKYDSFEDYEKEGWWSRNVGDSLTNWHGKVDAEAQNMLYRASRKSGVGFSEGWDVKNQYVGDEAMQRQLNSVVAGGGNPFSEATEYLKQMASDIKKLTGTGVSPPMQGRPPGVQVRP